MEYKVEITPLAEGEYSEAFHYYEEQIKGLGIKFEKETESLLNKLKTNPYIFQRKYKHYREAVYKRFPYFMVYEIINSSIIIHSFFHSKRNPKKKLKPRA